MRPRAPFQPEDLDQLESLLERATAVVPMREVHAGIRDPRIIGMRHDVDNHIEPAVNMAAWEHGRGYRSTYFILHSAPYWKDKQLLRDSVDEIARYGHEIGIHNAALSEAVRTGSDPLFMLAEAVGELREYGHTVTGTVAHGADECYDRERRLQVVNDELFKECSRPNLGEKGRTVGKTTVVSAPLASFGLDYDANWIDRGMYLSDSGGEWSPPGFDTVAELFPFPGQLHMLVHPDWWAEAFDSQHEQAAVVGR